MLNFIKTLLNHERYQTIAIVCCLIFSVWYMGCEPKCRSILDPKNEISLSEYNQELAIIQERALTAQLSLEQQQQLTDFIFDAAVTAANTGTFNYLPFVTGIGAIFGIGASVDNVRKRKEIKKLTNSK